MLSLDIELPVVGLAVQMFELSVRLSSRTCSGSTSGYKFSEEYSIVELTQEESAEEATVMLVGDGVETLVLKVKFRPFSVQNVGVRAS